MDNKDKHPPLTMSPYLISSVLLISIIIRGQLMATQGAGICLGKVGQSFNLHLVFVSYLPCSQMSSQGPEQLARIGRVLALHRTNLGSLSTIPFGSPNCIMNDP